MADKKISDLTAATTPLAGTEVLPIVQSSTTKKVSVADLTAGRAVEASSLSTTGNVGIGTTTPNVINGFTYPWRSGQVYSTSDALFIVNGGSGAGRFLLTGNGVADQRTWGLQQFGGVMTIAKYTDGQSPTTSLEFSQNSDVKVNNGDLVVGTAGKGIDFSANTNAPGMTSEKLTWYEEGTWTPTLTPASGSLTTYTSEGYYTRVGRSVTVRAGFKLVDVGTAAGLANFGGLPFTSMTMSDGGPAATGVCSERFALGHMFQCWVNSNATTGTFATTVNGAPPWTNTYLYVLSMTYQVA